MRGTGVSSRYSPAPYDRNPFSAQASAARRTLPSATRPLPCWVLAATCRHRPKYSQHPRDHADRAQQPDQHWRPPYSELSGPPLYVAPGRLFLYAGGLLRQWEPRPWRRFTRGHRYYSRLSCRNRRISVLLRFSALAPAWVRPLANSGTRRISQRPSRCSRGHQRGAGAAAHRPR